MILNQAAGITPAWLNERPGDPFGTIIDRQRKHIGGERIGMGVGLLG